MAEKLMKYADAVKQFDPVIGPGDACRAEHEHQAVLPAHVEFGGNPNTQLTPVSLGLPGSLPVLNEAAVDYAIKLGLALHCEIAEWSQFSRKNYFYPDMPRNYQISQYDKPTNGNGYLDVELDDGTIFRVPIERAHIEDDAGKKHARRRRRRAHRGRGPLAGRLQPRRRAADRDRHQADRGCGRPRPGDRRRLHAHCCATSCAR